MSKPLPSPTIPAWLAALEKAEAEARKPPPPDPNTFTAAEFAAASGVNRPHANQRIARLVAKGAIVRAGTRRVLMNGILRTIPQYRLR